MAKLQNSKKLALRFVGSLLLILICALWCGACTYTRSPEQSAKQMDFLSLDVLTLEGYIEIGQYKGLTLSQGGKSKSVAVWDAILSGADIKEYPEEHIYYYVGQIKDQYKYYADRAGISYEQLTSELGINEGAILKEARELTKRDIICAIIQKKESISLSAEEKQVHFDRYVEQYVSEYGYSEDYVRANMAEEIYGSMLYDKTTEFLVINNKFN